MPDLKGLWRLEFNLVAMATVKKALQNKTPYNFISIRNRRSKMVPNQSLDNGLDFALFIHNFTNLHIMNINDY